MATGNQVDPQDLADAQQAAADAEREAVAAERAASSARTRADVLLPAAQTADQAADAAEAIADADEQAVTTAEGELTTAQQALTRAQSTADAHRTAFNDADARADRARSAARDAETAFNDAREEVRDARTALGQAQEQATSLTTEAQRVAGAAKIERDNATETKRVADEADQAVKNAADGTPEKAELEATAAEAGRANTRQQERATDAERQAQTLEGLAEAARQRVDREQGLLDRARGALTRERTAVQTTAKEATDRSAEATTAEATAKGHEATRDGARADVIAKQAALTAARAKAGTSRSEATTRRTSAAAAISAWQNADADATAKEGEVTRKRGDATTLKQAAQDLQDQANGQGNAQGNGRRWVRLLAIGGAVTAFVVLGGAALDNLENRDAPGTLAQDAMESAETDFTVGERDMAPPAAATDESAQLDAVQTWMTDSYASNEVIKAVSDAASNRSVGVTAENKAVLKELADLRAAEQTDLKSLIDSDPALKAEAEAKAEKALMSAEVQNLTLNADDYTDNQFTPAAIRVVQDEIAAGKQQAQALTDHAEVGDAATAVVERRNMEAGIAAELKQPPAPEAMVVSSSLQSSEPSASRINPNPSARVGSVVVATNAVYNQPSATSTDLTRA